MEPTMKEPVCSYKTYEEAQAAVVTLADKDSRSSACPLSPRICSSSKTSPAAEATVTPSGKVSFRALSSVPRSVSSSASSA